MACGDYRPPAERRGDPRSIGLYNENRALIRELYALRAAMPWNASSTEVYLLLRAGLMLPVEEHNALVRSYIDAARSAARP